MSWSIKPGDRFKAKDKEYVVSAIDSKNSVLVVDLESYAVATLPLDYCVMQSFTWRQAGCYHRPYNRDEMRGLVGKILVCPDGDHHLVTDWNKEDNTVFVCDGYRDAVDLLSGWKTTEGTICGVAE